MEVYMEKVDLICMGIAELLSIAVTLFSFIYGIRHFFKRGKSLFLQCVTIAMGSHTLGTVYHLCQTITLQSVIEGFTPAYLGHIGFFLFFITASWGQMDRIIDDGAKEMKICRIIALIAPIMAALLFIPNCTVEDVPLASKISLLLVWIPALFSVYFNLKHAIIPDLGFGFIKAIKPYNILATCLGFSELLFLTAWNYLHSLTLVIAAMIFSVLCVLTMLSLKRGYEKWKI